MEWYVVHTKPHAELLAATLLERRFGLEVYLPEVMQQRRGKPHLVTLFPAYLFIDADLALTPPSQVDATPGVVRMVRFGDGTPQPLAAGVVVALRTQVAALNAVGGLVPHPFHPGDVVEITAGPLQGLAAVFVGPMTPAARVQVLLRFLGRDQTVSVAVEHLVPGAGAPPVVEKRARRTRGRGRWIGGEGGSE